MLLRILKRLVGIPPPEPGYWWAIDPYWEEINIHGTSDEFLDSFGRVPELSQHVFAAHWVVFETMNGSFVQFFFNSTGILAPEGVTALRVIGLKDSAEALDLAVKLIGEPYPRERDERLAIVEPLYEKKLSPSDDALADRLVELSESFLDGLGKGCRDFEPITTRYADQFRRGA